MKKKARLIFVLLLSCCFWGFVYWVSYRYTYEDLLNNKLYDESQLIPAETTSDYVPAITQQGKDKDNKEIISTKTIYILEKYDELSGELTKEMLPVPIELLGLDYNGVYQYTQRKTTEDNTNGRIELVIFQSGLLVLRKTIFCGFWYIFYK